MGCGYSGRAPSGGGGVLIHTQDGGEHWDVQLGDPDSGQSDHFQQISFIDREHGWVVQGKKLLRTSDGQNWEEVGTFPDSLLRYKFTSPDHGVALTGLPLGGPPHVLYVTQDGGRHWNEVWSCQVTLAFNGLNKSEECGLQDLSFVSSTVGYAVGGGGGYGGGDAYVVVAKTSDGGATWNVIYTSTDNRMATDVLFTDENTGFMRVSATTAAVIPEIKATTDGGRTWRGVSISGNLGDRFIFADPEVGILCARGSMVFTVDGGRHWKSSDFDFPEAVEAASLPRRDSAYVVGESGMVYRYRLVPASFTAKGIFPAPLLPTMDSALDTEVQQLWQQAAQVAQDAGVPMGSSSSSQEPTSSIAGTSGAGGSAVIAPGNSPSTSPDYSSPNGPTPSGSFVAAGLPASIPGCPETANALAASSAGGPSSTSSLGAASVAASNAGGFTQDTSGTGSSATSGFTQDTSLGATPSTSAPSTSPAGFVQDTSVASSTAASISSIVPNFVSQHRNLNLFLEGLQLAAQMPATVQCLKQSFQALKGLKDPQSAVAAISNIQGQVSGLVQMVHVAFQKP